MECLLKAVDSSQLPPEFGGSFSYDHGVWVERRLSLEAFLWVGSELLDRLEDWREDVGRCDFPEDVVLVQRAIDRHKEIKEKISRATFEEVDGMGQELLKRFYDYYSNLLMQQIFDIFFNFYPFVYRLGGDSSGGSGYDSGYSGRSSSSSSVVSNPDIQV